MSGIEKALALVHRVAASVSRDYGNMRALKHKPIAAIGRTAVRYGAFSPTKVKHQFQVLELGSAVNNQIVIKGAATATSSRQ